MARITSTVTVDGSGAATARITNDSSNESWHIDAVTVLLAAGGDAEANVYHGPPSSATFVEGTYSGGRDTSTNPGGSLIVEPGEFVVVVWSGATPGDEATFGMRYRVDRRQF